MIAKAIKKVFFYLGKKLETLFDKQQKTEHIREKEKETFRSKSWIFVLSSRENIAIEKKRDFLAKKKK